MFLSSLLSASYAVEKFEPIALWLTVGVLIQAILTGVILFLFKKEYLGAYAKSALWSIAAYLLILAIVFFSLDIAKNYSDSYTEENWLAKDLLIRLVLIPLLILASVSLCGFVAFGIVSKYKPERKKLAAIVTFSAAFIALISALICLAVYYNKKIAADGYYNSETANVEQIALWIGSLLAIVSILALTLFDRQKLVFDARSLAYAGICASMSFALSYIKLWEMPQGGSVTLVSMLPLMIYAYIFGVKKGVFVSFVYGVLQAVQDPWLIHPAQFLLDYPVAFSAVGLAGIIRNMRALDKLPQVKFAVGAVIAGAMRFICHVLSGVFAFEAYAEGQNVWAYSLAYNSYVFVDVVLIVVAGIFVFSSKSFLHATAKLDLSQKTKHI